MGDARRLWQRFEPYHAVVYFAPEAQAACTALGTRGYWMSYFALRAAPLGAAPPELITAVFYGFAPRLVPDPRRPPASSARAGSDPRARDGSRC